MKTEYWPRLLKETKKVHFLKTDFDKWVDEDEQEARADDDYGNFGMNDDGGLGGIDFSKLGTAGGMGETPDMEDAGTGAGADDDDDDSDDMPDLEDDGKAEVAEPSKPGIEEVS